MSNPIYSVLPTSQHFRLLTLHRSENNILTARLDTHLVEDSLEYVALSYTWGLPGKCDHLYFGEHKLILQENLAAALHQFLIGGLQKPIWIDAICINQEDDGEKCFQIPLMRTIYRNATIVYAWIGTASEQEEDTISGIVYLAGIFGKAERILGGPMPNILGFKKALDLGLPSIDGPMWPILGHMLTRSWFARLWVLQEVLLAKEILVVCGKSHVQWADLIRLERVIVRWQLHKLMIDPPRTQIKDIFEALNVLSNFTWCKSKMALAIDNTVPLPGLLHVMRRKRVHEPLDRVYGLLGLVPKHVRDGVNVNYQIPVAQGWTNFVGQCLLTDYKLELLSQIAPRRGTHSSLPSWCAELDQPAPINQFGGMNGVAAGYHAGFQPPFQERTLIALSPDTNMLHIQGFVVDMVENKLMGSSVPLPTPLGKAGALILDTWEDECLQLANATTKGFRDTEAILRMLSRMLVANRAVTVEGLYIPLAKNSVVAYTEHKKKLKILADTGKLDSDNLQSSGSDYPVIDARTDRAFIVTEKSRLGYAPSSVEVGDIVCVFRNSLVPYILRRSLSNDNLTWSLIGETYIDGLMYAETLNSGQGAAENELVEIIIC